MHRINLREGFFINELSLLFDTDLPIILAGDFHCVESRIWDTKSHSTLWELDGSEMGAGLLHDFCSKADLLDCWQCQNPTGRTFHFFKNRIICSNQFNI